MRNTYPVKIPLKALYRHLKLDILNVYTGKLNAVKSKINFKNKQ